MIDSNVGGYFAPFLKLSGFDPLEIQGKAQEDVIVFIDGDNGRVTVEPYTFEAEDSHLIGNMLTNKYGGDEKGTRGVAVFSAGQAAEHVRIAAINSTWYDVRRNEARIKQAGRGGAGRVSAIKRSPPSSAASATWAATRTMWRTWPSSARPGSASTRRSPTWTIPRTRCAWAPPTSWM